jgi:hypothetical protein
MAQLSSSYMDSFSQLEGWEFRGTISKKQARIRGAADDRPDPWLMAHVLDPLYSI